MEKTHFLLLTLLLMLAVGLVGCGDGMAQQDQDRQMLDVEPVSDEYTTVLSESSEPEAAAFTGQIGYIASAAGSVGSEAANIPFISADRRQNSLHKVRQPVTILVFARHEADSQYSVLPELAELSEQLRNLPVTVAQVSLHSGQDEPGRITATNDSRVVLLFDERQTAWNAYGRPEENHIFLIDDRGTIRASAPYSRLDEIAGRARRMGNQIQDEYDQMYLGDS